MEKLKPENVEFIKGDIKNHLHKLRKVTHLYAFDFLFSKDTMSVIYAFLRKHKGIYFASFRKPAEFIKQDLKFSVVRIFIGRMTHVKESHNCYVYKIV